MMDTPTPPNLDMRLPASGPTGQGVSHAADAPALLDVRNLSVSFGGKEVVSGLSFSIAAGEKVALVGESGS
ncbi:MAG: microcin ABC transporter ATP-binding protein, partial [Hylemonella sp.]